MKNILFLIALFILISTNSFSQDYMDKIVDESCTCLEKISEELKGDELNMKLGICMLEASMPYKKKLKKDYDIDLEKFDGVEGEKLGRIIGLKLATVCPQILLRMADASGETDDLASVSTVNGLITNIDSDLFVSFSVKDENGKTAKYFWLNFFETEIDLANDYNSLKDKNVFITYDVMELFDPKIKEYRNYNVISSMEIMK